MRMRTILAAAGCAAALALASCASTQGPAAAQPAGGNAGGGQTAAGAQAAQVAWADDAWAAFQAEVPKAVQKIAKKQMEKEAREKGVALIDMDFYNQVKKEQGR
jgi:hypothetical protein